MICYLQLSSCDEWFEIEPRSAVLVDVRKEESISTLLHRLAASNPSFAAFFGSTSEKWHDAFDGIAIAAGREVLTTWHPDEGIDEVIEEFTTVHVPLSSVSGIGYVIGVADGALIESAKRLAETHVKVRPH